MKPSIISSLVITAATALLSSVSQAQPSVRPGTEALVTLTMTAHVESPGTVTKNGAGKPIQNGQPTYENDWAVLDRAGNPIQRNYEYVSKIEKFKLSNRELVEQFRIQGVIPEITGWSFKIVELGYVITGNTEEETEDGEGPPRFFLTKIGQAPIDVTEYIDITDVAFADAARILATTNNRYATTGSLISSTLTVTGTSASRSAMQVSIGELDGETLQLYAIADISTRVVKVGSDFVAVFQGGKLVNITGGLIAGVEPLAVIDGSWSFTSPKVIPNLSSVYPNIRPLK